MNEKIIEYYESKVEIFKALSHPFRLFIIDEISKKECCVNELAQMIDVDISTVSKHLAILKNSGIVSSRKENNCIYYKLKLKCVLDFFQCCIRANCERTSK